MPQPALASPPPPIAGRYVVDPARPLTGAGGGLPAFAAADLAGQTAAALMAVQVERRRPPRALALQALETPIEGVLAPLAHGPAPAPGGAPGYYLIAPAPPGPPLAARLRPWPEHELLEQVLRPAARSLDRLARLGVTHRAIRPDNVFLGGPGGVVLGMAWAAPAALHQPAIAEPPYVIQSLPEGRGDGSIADDVYALGVLLLTLARGQAPLAGLDDATILRCKLERGSFAALAGDARLPPVIADLVRAMLAEDPEHRPSPALLTEPSAARARKVAARPPRQAQRAMQIAGHPVANARLL
ncbi:MAG TPA: hypothetical protein VFW75_00430, partial [Acetobacteraceae bacterium]|nr:hypothetical protein [Acetobacteraceae bacterium]